ncbi:MAG: XTP/dITP diphosphatase [Firmicutes bacterium]|nr:XTP/dITP diphosphatase [Bacillota bacterium]
MTYQLCKQLVLATENKNKVREMQALLEGTGFEVYCLSDFPKVTLPPEDGISFVENAAVKACFVARELEMLALADDSGLCVDALNGAPGIYSARYAGEDKDDKANNRKLLEELTNVPEDKRQAAFHCAIAIADPEDNFIFFEGECPGIIGFEEKGDGGFGYDPLFYIPRFDKTMAEITAEEKNQISHRAIAMNKAAEFLRKIK